MTDQTNIERNLQPLCDYLEKTLQKELAVQDHITTGKLRDSIKVAVRKTATGSTIEGHSLPYGKYVDTGRRKFIKKVPIDALIGWIKARGISLNGKKEKDVAFAIQYSIWKNGIPTSGDASRKAFVSKTMQDNESKIMQDIRAGFGDFFQVSIYNIIRDVKTMHNGG